MIGNFLKTKREPTRAERQRAKYDAWRAQLDRYRSAIDALEATKAEADATLGRAIAGAVETGEIEVTDDLKDAASTVQTCTVLLERLAPLSRAERLRDVSPEPFVRMRPKRIDTSAEGTDMSGVLAGVFEPIPDEEG